MSTRKRILTLAFLLNLSWGFSVCASDASEGPGTQADIPALTLEHLKPAPKSKTGRIHPQVRLLDQKGRGVRESNGPLSLMKTCGGCHHTEYIAKNNYHAQVGFDEMHPPGETQSKRAWDTGPGIFGRWNPLTYRVLSPRGSDRLDMGTADWIMSMGPRHVGGGPAELSRYAVKPLTGLEASQQLDPETHIMDPVSRSPRPWDWKASGVVELNCLMCHMKRPNNVARIAEIKSGQFQWASTATLLGSGLVEKDQKGYRWVPGAFESNGSVLSEMLMITDPKSNNCRLCHARSCRCQDPVVFENSLENWSAETTGEVFSSERMFDSGMNLKGKGTLSRPWDVHAQRLLECVNCHYAMNNPKYNEKAAFAARPLHLRFDARRLSTNDYLLTPDHNLAKGHSAQGTVARRLDGSMRDCRDCHEAEARHDFLPYKAVHFEKLSCQTCHIPRIYTPARRTTDWTIIHSEGKPVVEYRGVHGKINDPASLIEGYEPVLLLHEEKDATYRLGPNNLIVSWFWVEGSPERPVRLVDLKAAFLKGDGAYHPDIVQALDTDGNGDLSPRELRLDMKEKVDAVATRLRQVGAVNPRIQGEIQPYTHSHGVATGAFVMADCQSCHSRKSRINQEIQLAAYTPDNVLPQPVKDANTKMIGDIRMTEAGTLIFRPGLDPSELYIHGTLRPQWLDLIGMAMVLGSILGVMIHGGLRIMVSRRRQRGKSQ